MGSSASIEHSINGYEYCKYDYYESKNAAANIVFTKENQKADLDVIIIFLYRLLLNVKI